MASFYIPLSGLKPGKRNVETRHGGSPMSVVEGWRRVFKAGG